MSSFDISKYTGAAVLLSLQKFCKLIDAASSCAKLFSIIAYNERRLSRETYQSHCNEKQCPNIRQGVSESYVSSFDTIRIYLS